MAAADPGGDGPPAADRPAAGSPRLPAILPRDATDVEIDRQARCADPRASLTHLFFSDDLIELARARAICALVHGPRAVPAPGARPPGAVRRLGRRAASIDGAVVAEKRGRGRPPKVPRPRLVVDEITGAAGPHRRLTGAASPTVARRGWSSRRHPGARLLAGPGRAALHADAVRPRRRRDQARAAGRRPDPLRQPADQRAVDVLRAAERRQAQHQRRPRRRRGASSWPSALAGASDIVVENYRAGVMARLGLGAETLTARVPPPRSTPRSPATGRPGRGSTGGPTRRSSPPRPGSPSCRATPAAATTPTTRSATPTPTPAWS